MNTVPLWRRNVAGAIVLGASLTFVAVTQLWPDWSRYRAGIEPDQTVGRDEAANLEGRRWQLESVRRTDGGPDVPAGAVETVVTLSRSGEAAGQDCSGTLTDGTRRWDAEPFPAVGAGATSRCGQAGPLELAFLTPAGVTPTAVDITRSDGRILLRLLL
ncbi:MAG: hypothetical protein ACKOQ4_08545 [Mycobacterium sp.]